MVSTSSQDQLVDIFAKSHLIEHFCDLFFPNLSYSLIILEFERDCRCISLSFRPTITYLSFTHINCTIHILIQNEYIFSTSFGGFLDFTSFFKKLLMS